MINLVGIHKAYGSNQVLKNISLELKRGETVSIIGRSGEGKSTLIKCINGLVEPDSGEIYIDGVNIKETNITKTRQRIGIVFQSFNLFEHLTVIENLTIGPIKILKKTRMMQKKEP